MALSLRALGAVGVLALLTACGTTPPVGVPSSPVAPATSSGPSTEPSPSPSASDSPSATARSSSPSVSPTAPPGATGYGVRLLDRLVDDLTPTSLKRG